jgi:ADP-heptose:LPS heptosyltransferase
MALGIAANGGLMGLGDQLLATGMARGAKARGKRIAFGDRRHILWDKHSHEIFRDNPNIAPPGAERDSDVEWLPFYKGHRIYNRQAHRGARWIWNMSFRAIPGELFFNNNERRNAKRLGFGFIVIEPDVPHWKTVAPNKDWGREKYQLLADGLRADGYRLVQFRHERSTAPLAGVDSLRTLNFRDAAAILAHAALYIGPEGGMHHAAAAVGRPAVVIFGGFIPPSVTGYPGHVNLTGGAEACGNYMPCSHCKAAMAAISVDDVHQAARGLL